MLYTYIKYTIFRSILIALLISGMIGTSQASTNLHLDISDAVNLMVNVTVPKGVDEQELKQCKFL